VNLRSHHPPPVRFEWLIAATRVLLAVAALLDVWLDSWSLPRVSPLVFPSLFYYLAYSIAVLGLVWKPVRFTPSWGLAVHTFDIVAFSLFAAFAEGPASPVLFYFLFIVIAGTLRWRSTGALWTAAAAIAGLGAAYLFAAFGLHLEAFGLDQFVRRSVQLAGTAALVGYLGTYSHPLAGEISRVALWPRRRPRTSRALVTDIIARSAEVLEVPSVVLLWTAPNNSQINLAWQSDEGLLWIREPEGTYDMLVAPELERQSFQAYDATKDNGRVIYWSAGRLQYRRCRPVNERLRARFAMRRVQSYRLDGEFIRGRLFCFGKRRMPIDDLIVGELVARLAVSQLDSLYLVTQMGEAAATEERLRLSRDLHDSLAQTLAGAALQLLAVRRLLDFNPAAARQRLDEVQYQLKLDQLEVRSLIRRLRPVPGAVAEYSAEYDVQSADLKARLEELRLRIQKQWDVSVAIQVETLVDDWPEAGVEQVFRLIQEAALNAARHAEASIIRVDVTATDAELRLAVEDDGKGYPFSGSFDLAALTDMEKGPLILRERVAALRGGLLLQTTNAGTRIVITVPSALVET
jgi:signal transduction histidine kinase